MRSSETVEAVLLLALLADARLPVGGHAHSAGLEPALADGLPPSDLAGLCKTRLRTVVRVEAGTAVVARHLVLGGADLAPVDDAWAARTPSGPLRAASRQLGRGYARLADRLFPATLPAPPAGGWCRPVVVGHLAAHAGLRPLETGVLCGYDDVQSLASAALKLMPGDPIEASAMVLSLAGDIREAAEAVVDLTRPDDIPATAAPHLEALSLIHATRRQRLFHA